MRYSALLIAALILGGRSALAADADICRMPGDTDRRIAACTRVTDDKGLSAATRALAPATISPAPKIEPPPQHPAPAAHSAQSSYTRQQDLERLMAQAIAMRRR